MKIVFVFMAFFLGFMPTAYAQGPDIVSEPICFQIRNTQDFTMYGTIWTDFYTTPEGTKARHSSAYRLEAAGTKDSDGNFIDRAEYCSFGPFYEGRKLEINIRTLFPVFSCKTRVDQGEILLQAKRKDDDSGYDYWLSCYE